MKRFLLVLGLAAILFSACQSTDLEIPEDLSPGEFFLTAQAASTEFNNYEKALVYYNTFVERYPDDPQLIIEAEYEIAFLYYKMNDYTTSKRLFQELIDKYQTPEAALFPAWPEVLSEKIIQIIEEKTRAEAEKRPFLKKKTDNTKDPEKETEEEEVSE